MRRDKVLQSRHLSWRDQKGQNCKIYFSKIIFKILFKKGLKKTPRTGYWSLVAVAIQSLSKSISKSLPNQLGIHLFLVKQKNCAPTVWYPTWQISPLYVHICALSASAYPASRANLNGALRFLAGLFVS
jgi:hypothetical protein